MLAPLVVWSCTSRPGWRGATSVLLLWLLGFCDGSGPACSLDSSVTDTCCFTFALSDRASGGHLDLMQLIGVPLPPSVSFLPGFEGFPAYSFGPDANIGRLAATFLPGSFYRDFSIIVAVSRRPFRAVTSAWAPAQLSRAALRMHRHMLVLFAHVFSPVVHVAETFPIRRVLI